jgi:hypothetical protein
LARMGRSGGRVSCEKEVFRVAVASRCGLESVQFRNFGFKIFQLLRHG